MRGVRRIHWWCLLWLAALALPAQARDVPYVPTPEDVVREMLTLAKVGPEDLVYDLGSGDGRIVIMAAKEFGARGRRGHRPAAHRRGERERAPRA